MTCDPAHARPRGLGKGWRDAGPVGQRSRATASRPLSSGFAGWSRLAEGGQARPRSPRRRTAPARSSGPPPWARGRPAAPPAQLTARNSASSTSAGAFVPGRRSPSYAATAAARTCPRWSSSSTCRRRCAPASSAGTGATRAGRPRALRKCETSAFSVDIVIAESPYNRAWRWSTDNPFGMDGEQREDLGLPAVEQQPDAVEAGLGGAEQGQAEPRARLPRGIGR